MRLHTLILVQKKQGGDNMGLPIPIVGDLIKSGFDLIDNLFTSDEEKAAERFKITELAQKGDLAELQAHVSLLQGQMAINAKEAGHKSVFVAGWRPFVGWVCGFGLLYVSLVEPIARFTATMFGYDGDFPVIDTSLTMQVLLGMLGIAGMRSYDKREKTQTDKIS